MVVYTGTTMGLPITSMRGQHTSAWLTPSAIRLPKKPQRHGIDEGLQRGSLPTWRWSIR